MALEQNNALFLLLMELFCRECPFYTSMPHHEALMFKRRSHRCSFAQLKSMTISLSHCMAMRIPNVLHLRQNNSIANLARNYMCDMKKINSLHFF